MRFVPLFMKSYCAVGAIAFCKTNERRKIMSNNNDDFDFDDFLMFETIKGGGGCLVSALSIIGTIRFIVALII